MGGNVRKGLFCFVFRVAGTGAGAHSESTCMVQGLDMRLGEGADEWPGQHGLTTPPTSIFAV